MTTGRVAAILPLLLPAAWAQTVQVQGATFQVAQGTSAFPLCMTNSGAQIQLSPCANGLPSQTWQVGSTTGVQPGTLLDNDFVQIN
jgi:hypothetical protein